MTLTRRDVIGIGGATLADLFIGRTFAAAADIVEVAMLGNADGSRVWFEPTGVLVRPGQTIRWTNRDRGNTHTATAYHTSNGDRPLRIPAAAEPWDSGYLLPGNSFQLTLNVTGVYDYFCVPHELAGMVGRIVVATERGAAPDTPEGAMSSGPAEDAFPTVERILRQTTAGPSGG